METDLIEWVLSVGLLCPLSVPTMLQHPQQNSLTKHLHIVTSPPLSLMLSWRPPEQKHREKLKALWEVELYILQPHSQVCLSHHWWSRSFAWATAEAEPVLYCNLKASISHILRAPLPQTLFSVWQQAAFIFGNSFTLLLVCKLYFFTADNGRNLGPRNTI